MRPSKGEKFSRQAIPLPYGKAEAEVTRVKERSEAERRLKWMESVSEGRSTIGRTVGRDN